MDSDKKIQQKRDESGEAIPSPQQDLQAFVHDDVNFSESLGLESSEGGIITGARRVGEGLSSAGDHQGEGVAQDTLLGKMHQGEENTENVARGLIARFNRDGDDWGEPEPSVYEYWVDWVARDGEKTLKIQVTRVGASLFFKRFSKFKRANTQSTDEEAADRLRDAIEEKRKKYEKLTPAQRGELTLALDAVAFLSHSFESVAQAFRRQHGVWARHLGFDAIWIVGLSINTTHRLDFSPE